MRSNAWITLLAYEARGRHVADCRRKEQTARRLAALHSRVLADLRYAIAVGIEGFHRTDGDQSGSALTCHNGSSAEGFVVSRTHVRIGTRSLAIDLNAGTLRCRYETTGSAVREASDQRVLAIEIGNDGAALSLWDRGLHRTFATVDLVSAFLLAPILGEANSSTLFACVPFEGT